MKFILRFLVSLIIAVGIACVVLLATGNGHLVKAVRSTYLVGKTGPTIDDYTKFENRKVEAGSGQAWQLSRSYNEYEISDELLKEVEKFQTTALLIIKSDSIRLEKYWNDYSDKSLTNSFSMAKSLTSLAIGAAIKEGKIKSVKQKVGDFLPEFAEGKKAKISIEDLLQMNSGIDFGESYGDPFGFMAKTYYGKDLYDLTVEKPVKYDPNEVWHYQGGNTLLLSFILEKATGKSLSDYFSEKFWKPIGAKQDALWSINKENGRERSYCCFYSNAKDFARIGQLMLDSGRWNGKKLINQDYYERSLSPVNIKNESGKLIDYYGYQWWLGTTDNVSFAYARGIQGQYIIWVPKWDAVIVRLGHKRDPTRGAKIPSDVFTYLKIAKQSLGV